MHIDTDFEAAAIDHVASPTSGSPLRLRLRSDNAAEFAQWFAFELVDLPPGGVDVRIEGLAGSSYPKGWVDYRVCMRADGGEAAAWRRLPTDFDGDALAFHAPVDDPADAERLKLEADLYDGVRNGEFSLHFQPITRSQSGAVVGVEALIRWRHPVHGLVPPATFIPLAESIGLINYLGNWVLKAACMQLVAWDGQGLALQYVAVNVSPQQFRDPRFTQSVREAIALTGIDPRRIVLEITESLLMHDPAQAKGLLEELTDLGIRFAIDDFGTGYSSLAYLQRFPLAKLKIDRSFVENLLTSRNDRAIVSAVVGLAQTLDLELVAEGVETEAQRELLTEMGCNHIQGWLVCQALPSEELARRFEAQQLRLHAA